MTAKKNASVNAVRCLFVGICTIGANVALAQAPANTPATDGAPYWLRVTASEINVRSRADLNSLPVTRVARDTALQAVREEHGWHRILPPVGTFGLVHGRYIDRQGAKRGVVAVSSGTLRVRAGSTLRDVDPFKTEVLSRLAGGAEVQVVGVQSDWLKIAPPDGVHFFVHSDFVERIDAQVAARLRAATTATPLPKATPAASPEENVQLAADVSKPAAIPESQPVAQDSTGETSAAAADEENKRLGESPPALLVGEWGQRLAKAETDISEQLSKSALERSWAEILTHLRPIAAQREEPQVAKAAGSWITQLERRVSDRVALEAAIDLREREARKRAQHEREMQRIRAARRSAATPAGFDARGVLRPDFALPAGEFGLRYKLIDPFTKKVQAHVEFPSALGFDVKPALGKYVGVRGKPARNPGESTTILRVTHVTVLNPDKSSRETR